MGTWFSTAPSMPLWLFSVVEPLSSGCVCITFDGSEELPTLLCTFWRFRFRDPGGGLWSTASRAKAFLADCSPRGVRGILGLVTMMMMISKARCYSV